MTFYERFINLCNENNISPYALGKKININKSNFSSWKQGRSLPGYEALLKISNYFNVSVDYLVGNQEIPQQKIYIWDDPNEKDNAMLFSNNSPVTYITERIIKVSFDEFKIYIQSLYNDKILDKYECYSKFIKYGKTRKYAVEISLLSSKDKIVFSSEEFDFQKDALQYINEIKDNYINKYKIKLTESTEEFL